MLLCAVRVAQAFEGNKFTLPFASVDGVRMLEGYDYRRDDCDLKATVKEKDACIEQFPDFDSESGAVHTHEAFDFARPDGKPFVARSVADHGQVVSVTSDGYLSSVIVRYDTDGTRYGVEYGHVVGSVKVGDLINRGDPIGTAYENQQAGGAGRVAEWKLGGYCRGSERPRRKGTTIYDRYHEICFPAHIHLGFFENGQKADPYGVCGDQLRYSCTPNRYPNVFEILPAERVWLSDNHRLVALEDAKFRSEQVAPLVETLTLQRGRPTVLLFFRPTPTKVTLSVISRGERPVRAIGLHIEGGGLVQDLFSDLSLAYGERIERTFELRDDRGPLSDGTYTIWPIFKDENGAIKRVAWGRLTLTIRNRLATGVKLQQDERVYLSALQPSSDVVRVRAQFRDPL
jgi:hypothetical protein